MKSLEQARQRNRQLLIGFRFNDETEVVQDEHFLHIPKVEAEETWCGTGRPCGIDQHGVRFDEYVGWALQNRRSAEVAHD